MAEFGSLSGGPFSGLRERLAPPEIGGQPSRRMTFAPFALGAGGVELAVPGAVTEGVKGMLDLIEQGGTATRPEDISPAAALSAPLFGGLAGVLAAPRGALASGAARRALPIATKDRQFSSDLTDRISGMANSQLKATSKVDDGTNLVTTFDRFNTDEGLKTSVNFRLENPSGMVTDIGDPGSRAFSLSPRAQMDSLVTVEKAVTDFIKKERPFEANFAAARQELIPLYERFARRIAKQNDGEFVQHSPTFFGVRFPKNKGGGSTRTKRSEDELFSRLQRIVRENDQRSVTPQQAAAIRSGDLL